MKILIFGGNRFVGKLVTEQLVNNGHEVTILNRSGKSYSNCTVIQCDRNNKNELLEKLNGLKFDCIIDMCIYNVTQASVIYEIFNDTTKYIFLSSIAAYQKPKQYPITETFELGKWDEFGEYGKLKAEVEKYFINKPTFPFISIRPTYILGKDNHIYREKYFFDSIINNTPIEVSNLERKISFVFSEDVANVICKLATTNTKLRECYNICTDDYVTIKEFIKLISSIVNKEPIIKLVDKCTQFVNDDCTISNTKVKQAITEIEFKSIKQGLTQYYEYTY